MSAFNPALSDATLLDEELAVAPMSAAQRQLWFLQKMNPECRAYNVTAIFRLHGELDIEALRRAIRHVVGRHESLRTTFALKDGQPVQQISGQTPSDEVLLAFEDLETMPEGERTALIQRTVEREGARAFDLERGPVFSCRILRRAATEHLLIVALHHIISDGWSIGVLIRELKILYAAEVTGGAAALPELPIQYADYSAWQQQRILDGEMDSDLEWWRRELEGAPTILQLPSDRPRPSVQSYRGAQVQFELGPVLSSELKRFGRQEQTTLFMSLIAAFAVLLYRYTGVCDLLIGTPVANRLHKELHHLIGCFVNPVVVRVRLGAAVTFRELVKQVRSTALDAFEHQELPFERIVQALAIGPEPSHNPLFQVMFLLQNNDVPEPSVGALQVEECPGSSHSSRFDLSLSMEESASGVRGFWEYSSDLFDPVTIQRMTRHFVALLGALLRSPAEAVATVPYLSREEISEIESWGVVEHPYGRCEPVHQLFERQVLRSPHALAVAHAGRSLTYAELNAYANRIAWRLQAAGVGLDDLVGICSERSLDWIAGLLGILKAGAGYLSLDPRYPADRLRVMIQDANPRFTLAGEGLASLFQGSGVEVANLAGEDAISGETPSNPEPRGRADSAAYSVYTSGSTGTPKAVVMCHGALFNLVCWHHRTYRITANDRATQFSRMGFDASAWEIWPYLTRGASVHIVDEEERLSPERVQGFMIDHAITIGFAPPVIAESLLNQPWPPETRLRALLTGSDRLIAYPPEGLPFRYYNHYGPTEAAVIVTAGPVDPETKAASPPSIGRALDNSRILILDEHLQFTPALRSAELYIGGEPLARGYLNRPALTAERFVPDPYSSQPGARMYRTGDLARYSASGAIEFIGRNDRQVKIRGFRVELGEIEVLLMQQPGIESAAVVLRESSGNQQLAAYLLANGTPPAPSVLRAALRRSLPEFMIPADFVFLDRFPVSPNGKLRREDLPPIEAASAPVETLVAPRGALEEKIAAIWRDVLGVSIPGVHDNFFDLGGQSITAVKVQELLRQRLNLAVPIVELFRNATIAELARYVNSDSGAEKAVASGRSRAAQREEARGADRRGRRREQGDRA
jgi:amino acid adenylation domain-containing protein